MSVLLELIIAALGGQIRTSEFKYVLAQQNTLDCRGVDIMHFKLMDSSVFFALGSYMSP